MTGSRKNSARELLDQIEDALVEAILSSSESDLREDAEERGEDPDKCIARIDELIASAKALSAKRRMERAKAELKNWRGKEPRNLPLDREVLRARFEKIRSRDPEFASKMLMAARKGEGLSDSDMEGFLEDLARLEGLDGEDSGE
jgi:hypothetical protein